MRKAQFYKICPFWFVTILILFVIGGILVIKIFCINSEWVAIAVVFLFGLAAIFREWIISCFKKPELKISIKNKPPDCHIAVHRNPKTGDFSFNSYYIRFKVENEGNYRMEDVEAMIVEIEEKKPNGKYEKKKDFLPMNIVWSYYREVTMPKIQPKLFKHCDLCHIARAEDANLEFFGKTKSSNLVVVLDVAKATFIGAYLLEPGDYKIKVIIAANNLKPIPKVFDLKILKDVDIIKNEWTPKEIKKLAQNVSIEIL